MKNRFDTYVKHMAEIRRLSTPSLEGIGEAGDYSRRLRENFLRIGQLAVVNREILETDLFPYIRSEEVLPEEMIADMMDLGGSLVNAALVENLDLPIANLLSERLLKDAREKGDLPNVIRRMDQEIESCYALLNMVERVSLYPEFSDHYRKLGMKMGDFFRKLREPEEFAAIEDEDCRELVLTNARYADVFYENYCGHPEANAEDLSLLAESLRISEDPFYKDLVPNFDWGYYRYRTNQYYSLVTNFCNERGFDEEQLSVIMEHAQNLYDVWYSNPDYYCELDKEGHILMSYYLNLYLNKKLTREEYKEKLLDVYRRRDRHLYDEGGLAENVQLPTEILCIFQGQELSEEDQTITQMLYQDVLDYVFRMPNSGTFSFMLEYLSHFIDRFIEIPGGFTFEDMMLNLLAALHPPTYVHSQMVARITICLCRHLLDKKPEMFIGICGCDTVEEVEENKEKILEFTFHAALCHDIGKLIIIDTIFIYGRNLLDMEFDLIKTHPEMGAVMLERYESTAAYADIARGHHKWYDNSFGYPADFDTRKSPLKTIIDLLLCADCLDAATDTIGRSYKNGIELDAFVRELEQGSGTHYAPWLSELLQDPKTAEDVKWLLSKGREHCYRETYRLLKSVQEQANKRPTLK